MAFQKAVKSRSKARIALIGPSGSGKTYSALAIGSQLAKRCGGKLAVIDTERGSASLYADKFQFDVLELESFHPAKYTEALNDAVKAGYAVVIIDSLSHAWMGKDGALELVDQAQARSQSGNSYVAWRNVTPLHNALVDSIVTCPAHIIATMRAKTEYVQEKDEKGKTRIRKIGMAPVMRDGIEYEFTIAGDITHEHQFAVTKSRCEAIADAVVDKPGAKFADALYDWLNSGGDKGEKSQVKTEPDPAPQPDTPAPPRNADQGMQYEAIVERLFNMVYAVTGKGTLAAMQKRCAKTWDEICAEILATSNDPELMGADEFTMAGEKLVEFYTNSVKTYQAKLAKEKEQDNAKPAE